MLNQFQLVNLQAATTNNVNKNRYMRLKYSILCLLLLSFTFAFASGKQKGINALSTYNVQDEFPAVIYFEGDNLQPVIDNAPDNSTIICNKNDELLVSIPIEINKPLTLKGLNARLPDKLGDKSIIEIKSQDVTITDFVLSGNAGTVPQSERAALITIYTGGFRIERGKVYNSSKEGIEVDHREFPNPVDGGVIRDIVGRGCIRDVISLGGPAGPESHIKNVLVENIRGYNSSLRGTVEISDGCVNVTVRKIYAENCSYAIDIQDHHKQEINRNVLINDVYALRCTHAIRTANHPNGHSCLTLMNITAEKCEKALYVYNTDNVNIQNVRIIGYNGEGPAMSLANCNALTIRDVTLVNCRSKDEGILVENCNDVTIDGVRLKNSGGLSSAITYRISVGKTFRNLLISHVNGIDVRDAGIVLEKMNKDATLTDYVLSNNIATIADRIMGSNRLLIGNLYGVK